MTESKAKNQKPRLLYLDIQNLVDDLKAVFKKWSDDDLRKKLYQAMVAEKICGISSFVPKQKSIVKWEANISHWFSMLYYIAHISNPVLIIGQSGTGKESMAKVIHRIRCDGREKPFIVLDAASIQPELIESELFGHEQGAYTGATKKREGSIKQSEGGTCFIDEINKISHESQSKLLRVIEYKEYRPIGSDTTLTIKDVHFIVTLQPQDLSEKSKSLLPDFRNRLNEYTAINLPTLSERLKIDPYIPYYVLGNLMKKDSMKYLTIKKSNKDLSSKHVNKSVAVNKSKIENRQITDLVKDEILRSLNINLEYVKILQLLEGNNFHISKDAIYKLACYEGYAEKNFRELINILEYAVIEAHVNGRNAIMIEDLPERVRSPQKVKELNTQEQINDDKSDIKIKDFIDKSAEIAKDFLLKQVERIYQSGNKLKTALRNEGVTSNSEYTNIRNKIDRRLGKGMLKKIQQKYKIDE